MLNELKKIIGESNNLDIESARQIVKSINEFLFTNYTDIGLYYNLGWVEKLKLESPAKLFNEGKWTYSTFVKWVNDCQALLGEGQFALAGHYYYYWLGMTNAAGVKIANTAAVNATLTHPRSKAIVEILKGFVATGALSTTTTWMEESGEFLDGECVMTTGSWWFVKTDNRWRKDLWEWYITKSSIFSP